MRYADALGLLTAGAMSLAALGQSVNIDFNDAAGTPADDYAAAGLAGFWNTVISDDGVVTPLLGLDGLPTGASVVHDGAGYQITDQQTTEGNDAALLRDYLFSFGPPMTLDFSGLEVGTYDIYTYTYFHDENSRPFEVWVNDDRETVQEIIGRFDQGFVAGRSHALHTVQVLDGTLAVTIGEGGDPLVNGLQLVFVPGPSGIATLLGAGFLVRRRRRTS